MTTFIDWCKKNNIEFPPDDIPGSWFSAHGLPMIVSCSCCGSTMALPNAMMNEENECFCADCAASIMEESDKVWLVISGYIQSAIAEPTIERAFHEKEDAERFRDELLKENEEQDGDLFDWVKVAGFEIH